MTNVSPSSVTNVSPEGVAATVPRLSNAHERGVDRGNDMGKLSMDQKRLPLRVRFSGMNFLNPATTVPALTARLTRPVGGG